MPKKLKSRAKPGESRNYLYRKDRNGNLVYVGTVSKSVKAAKVYGKRKRAGRGISRANRARRTFGGTALL